MFVDTAKVMIVAGKGGNGAVSFRHEIYVDKGGPDGGDGGKGGDVVFVASSDLNTLVDFRYKPELRAKPGESGSKRNRHGANGDSLRVKVPVGTIVSRGGEVVADFTFENQEEVVARGGDGGFGNAHFKSSTRQAPKIAENGEPGESFEIELELKLLADVGLVGLPNVGKSTFLSVVSNAKPEIADYAFTTLTPNLGVADIDNSSLLIADIPGLIEGASVGKGLGDAFLRHIERTSVLLHMIDAYSQDVAVDYQTIRSELTKYNPNLAKRPEIIVITKIDGLDDDIVNMQIDAVRKVSKNREIYAISSSAHKGTTEVLRALKKKLASASVDDEKDRVSQESIPTITLDSSKTDEAWQVTVRESEEYKFFEVNGTKIEKFAVKTDYDNYESVNRLRDIMKKMGITHELHRLGAEASSKVVIAGHQFTLVES